MSIVYMALENIVGGIGVQRRWMITFGFGLVHGFGFSFALRQTLQFAGSHLLTSLLSFNVGVELGQLLVLLVLVPALDLLFRRAVPERTGTIVLSALVAHTAWHWMIERWDRLRQFRFPWPALDAALLASTMRGLMVVVVAAGLVWLVRSGVRPAASSCTAIRERGSGASPCFPGGTRSRARAAARRRPAASATITRTCSSSEPRCSASARRRPSTRRRWPSGSPCRSRC